MKKLLFIALLCFTAVQVFSQSVVKLRGDTIEILKNQGNAELAIRNSTRDTAGFLLNVGNGATQFHAPHRVNDSTIQIGPITIIVQAPGVPPGTNSGDTIYIASAVDTFYTVPIGTAAGMIQTQYTISAPNFSEIRHSNWGPGLWTIPHLAPDSLAYIDIDSAALRAYLEIAAGGVIITADGGLQKNTPTNIQLGGTLLHNATISGGTGTPYTTEFWSGATAPLLVTHSDANNTNNVPILTLKRRGGTAPGGFYGGSLDFDLQNSALDSMQAAQILVGWNIATAGTEDAMMIIQGYRSGIVGQTWMNISGHNVISQADNIGFIATSGNTGGFFQGTAAGVVALSEAEPIEIINSSAVGNASVMIMDLQRQSGVFAGAVGEGMHIQYSMHASDGFPFTSGIIDHVLTDATPSLTVSDFRFAVADGSGTTSNVFLIEGKHKTISGPEMPTFASNAAAITGGLTTGDFYYNGDDVKRVH